MAAALVAASAMDVTAGHHAPDGLRVKQRGWTASLFVSPRDEHGLVQAPTSTLVDPSVRVNARAWRWLPGRTLLTIDVTNVFGREPPPVAGASFLDPAAVPGRGLLIQLRKTF